VTPDSAAARAGVRIYDVITGIDGEAVSVGNELRNRIAMKLPGESVDLQVVRDGSERTLSAVLGTRSVEEQARWISPASRDAPTPTALDGVELEAIGEQGIRVLSIQPGSVAEDARLLPNDLITAINQRPVSDIENARLLASQTWTVVLEIERDDRRRLLVLR
jgi:S1-C subfamily serine protease